MENSIGSEVIEIFSNRQKTLLLYILLMRKESYPASRLVVVKIHETPHVTLLPHHLPVRGVQELPGEPQPILQVVTKYKKKLKLNANLIQPQINFKNLFI